MKLTLKRFHDDGNTTVGAFYIDGRFKCFIIEDEERTFKKWGEMRFPEGSYRVGLRKEGGFHARYSKRYGNLHKGMLCVYNAPDWKIIVGTTVFQWCLFHWGNSEKDTAGCLLPNMAFDARTMRGSHSKVAYDFIYPEIADYIEKHGDIDFQVMDIEEKDGKNSNQ